MAATPGLVAAYGFEEGSGTTVTDASGNGHTGTILNANWAAAGRHGKALRFNGRSALVTVPDAAGLHLSTGLTLEAWVKPSTVTSVWRDVVYKGNDNYYLEASSQPTGYPVAGTVHQGAAAARRIRHRRAPHRQVVVPGRDLRRRPRPALRQRHPGRLDRSGRQDRLLLEAAPDRRRQHLRPLLRGPDRRRPDLQRRPHRRPAPNRPNHPGSPARPKQPATVAARDVERDHGLGWRGRPRLERLHQQHQRHRLPGRALHRHGLHHFRPDRHPTTTFKDTTVTANTSYSYRVRAIDATATSAPTRTRRPPRPPQSQPHPRSALRHRSARGR